MFYLAQILTSFSISILQYKVGSTCLELLYFEVLREESWCAELSAKRALAEAQLENLKAKLAHEKLLVSYQNLVKKQNLLFRYALLVLLNISEDLALEVKIVGKGVVPLLLKLLERHSQELLLVVVLYLKKLSVFGENATAMREMRGAGPLVSSISPLLFLDNELLVFNALKLLYNLALDREVRVALIRGGVFSKLVSFFSKGGGGVYSSVIVSLFYLVSCEQQGNSSLKHSKTLAALFGSHHPQLMGLLMEKAVLEEGPRGPLEYRPVLCSLLANLAANYQLAQAMVVDCSEAYGELLKITFATLESSAKDSSGNGTGLALLRLWRNVSCHGDPLFKLALSNYQERFLKLLLSVEGDLQRNSELLIEVAGILTNLSSPTSSASSSSSSVESTGNIDWLKLYRKYPVDGFLRKAFNQQWAGNDRRKVCEPMLRSLLLMVAGAAHQREMTTFLFEQNIVERLIDLLNGKWFLILEAFFPTNLLPKANQENDEIVLHIIYCFYVFVKVGVELREQIFQQTSKWDIFFFLNFLTFSHNITTPELADYLIDLMYDRNFRIKSLCTATLDMVADDGSEFARRIKAEKFTAYNAKWLAAIQSSGDRSSADEANNGSGSGSGGGGGGGGHSMLEDLFIYPDLFLKVDSLLADSSSENFEDSDNDNLQGGSGGGGGSRLSQK